MAGVLGALLTYALTNESLEAWASVGAAVASVAVAAATYVLARYTLRSVQVTERILETETDNFRKKQTIALSTDYFQVPIQLNSDTSLTPYMAHCDLIIFSKRLPEVRLLKAQYNKHDPKSQADRNRRKQYRSLVESIPVILNFYRNADLQYFEEIIDRPMFLRRFSDSLLQCLKAIAILNPELEAVPLEQLQLMDRLKGVCEDWKRIHGLKVP